MAGVSNQECVSNAECLRVLGEIIHLNQFILWTLPIV
jgi:hypothetical protein